MGKMSELQIETVNLESEWQQLLAEILSQEAVGLATVGAEPDNFPTDEEEWESLRYIPDIVFTQYLDQKPTAVEFKMFRWPNNWRSRTADAIAFMEKLLDETGYEKGIVIVSLEITVKDRASFFSLAHPNIELWDLQDLRSRASKAPVLLDKLDELISDTLIEASINNTTSTGRHAATQSGTTIVAKIRATPAGKAGWQQFEAACHEAIQFLFGRDLHNLVAQQNSYDKLNRMDLIGRIRPEPNSFWAHLATDFATRYVVFEAKNYKMPIGQAAIDITSKYLFRAGLRTVAIVIARKGASTQALLASAGHLREERKFIMVISMEDVCAMLIGADQGDAPENRLFERMDETLMKMGR